MPKWTESPKVGSFVKAISTYGRLFTKDKIYKVLPKPDHETDEAEAPEFWMQLDCGDIDLINPYDNFIQSSSDEVIKHAKME